jgi:plastocyanin
MRLTLLTTLVAFGAIACGGDKKAATAQAEAATPATPAMSATTSPNGAASATPAAEPAGAVVEVKMTGDGTSKAAFEPATLTIKAGTTVRFLNVSGGPHNIAFFSDSIPKGGADVLKKGMANAMSDLTGPFLMQPNEKYDVSFAGAPTGTYKGYCMPHVAFGMKITIKVQ